MATLIEKIDGTGAGNGENFSSEQEVRNYFTVENMHSMFGSQADEFPWYNDQDELDSMAEYVIENKLYCDF